MNYFEFYNLPVKFDIDKNELKKKYIELSRRYHPDFYTLASTKDRDHTLDMSTMNNEAYRTLSNKNLRIAYILELYGLLVEGDKASIPQEFLMEMMELNEKVFELNFEDDTEELITEITSEIKEIEKDLSLTAESNMNSFDRGEEQAINLEKVKDFYLKSKYVSRIKEQLKS